MKSLAGTFAFKIVVVGAVLGLTVLTVRLFAQTNCPDASTITTTYILEIKVEAKLKTPSNGSDMFQNFANVLKEVDADGKNGTCVFIKPFGDAEKIKGPPFSNLRTSAATTAKKAATPVLDGSVHVTQTTATEATKETASSVHVTQRVAVNSPSALAKVLACFEEPPPAGEKPATSSPKPSPRRR